MNDTNLTSQNIYLNSDNASVSYNSAHKVFYFEYGINPASNINVLMGLTNFEMVNSMYNIGSNNNNITIETATNTLSLDIDRGNYSTTSLLIELNQRLADNEVYLGGLITVDFNEDNYVFRFSGNIQFNIISSSMETELGLSNQLPTGYLQTYTATDVCYLGGDASVYIHLNNIGMYNINSQGQLSNVISKLNINVNFGNYVFYNSFGETNYFKINNNEINYLEVQLTDHYGNTLELNGSKWSMVLTIHYQYKRDEKEVFHLFNQPLDKKLKQEKK